MASRVRRDRVRDLRGHGGLAHGPLDDGLVQMVRAYLLGRRLRVGPSRREDPLPDPLTGRVQAFAA